MTRQRRAGMLALVVIAATVIWPLIVLGYAENTVVHMWINQRLF